jgi:phosphatidate phosphatase APP1
MQLVLVLDLMARRVSTIRAFSIALLVLMLGAGTAVNAAEGEEAQSWQEALSSNVRRSLVNIEEFAEVYWRIFALNMELNEPRHIAAYSGYGNESHVWVEGRLLANKPEGGPWEDAQWWDNLLATYQRWASDEITGATMRLQYGDEVIETVTDDEGYYRARLKRDPEEPADDRVTARHVFERRIITGTHRLFIPSPGAEFMIISDMDDTVIHTGITNTLKAAQLTFLHNAKTRKPLAGVGELYQTLVRGTNGAVENPLFYVSNSAWNMWDLLRDFIALNELPPGPVLLRDIGFRAGTSDHKISTIREIMSRFDPLPAIMVGDSGQHDAQIYARIAEEFPGRVRAIYVRDVDPDTDSIFDTSVDEIIERAAELSVPFLRVAHSADVAKHAATIGLLPATQLDEISEDVTKDQQRETLSEAADITSENP